MNKSSPSVHHSTQTQTTVEIRKLEKNIRLYLNHEADTSDPGHDRGVNNGTKGQNRSSGRVSGTGGTSECSIFSRNSGHRDNRNYKYFCYTYKILTWPFKLEKLPILLEKEY